MTSGGKEGENRNRSHYSTLLSYSAKTYALTGENTHTHTHRLDSAISLPLGRIFLPVLMERIIRRHKRKQMLLSARQVAEKLMFAILSKRHQHVENKNDQLLFFTMPRIAYIL